MDERLPYARLLSYVADHCTIKSIPREDLKGDIKQSSMLVRTQGRAPDARHGRGTLSNWSLVGHCISPIDA
jgi:hypothetical protein